MRKTHIPPPAMARLPTVKRRAFAVLYATGCYTPADAAGTAGYASGNPKGLTWQGSALLRDPDIKDAIRWLREAARNAPLDATGAPPAAPPIAAEETDPRAPLETPPTDTEADDARLAHVRHDPYVRGVVDQAKDAFATYGRTHALADLDAFNAALAKLSERETCGPPVVRALRRELGVAP